jgi:hypothetical protein
MRRVFHQDWLNRLFFDQGYVVIPLISKAAVNSLKEEFNILYRESGIFDSFFTTTHHPEDSLRIKSDRLIRSYLELPAFHRLDRYNSLYGNFMIKDPGDTECGLHQDWTFVDESACRTVNVWLALDATDIQNGCIHVMPKSQRMPFRIRGRNNSMPYSAIGEQIIRNDLIPVPLLPGEAVIFDSSVIHYSPVNTSSSRRHAASLMFYPAEAELVHYRFDLSEQKVRKYRVDESFFLQFSSAEDVIPEHCLESVCVPAPLSGYDEFVSLKQSL